MLRSDRLRLSRSRTLRAGQLAVIVAVQLVAGCNSGENRTEKGAAGERADIAGSSNTARGSLRPEGPENGTGLSPSAVLAESVGLFEPYVLLRSMEADSVSVNAIAFAPDGKRLVTGGGTPSIWEVGSDEPLRVFDNLYPATGTIVEADALAISADGSLLAIGGGDGVLHLIDLTSMAAKHSIEAHDEGVPSVAFSRDGKIVASSGYDGQAKLWNCETGERISSWKVEEGRGFRLDLSPDGKTVVSGGTDAVLWSAETGKRLGDLNLGDERVIQVMNVAFSPDGKRIATAEATADLENAALVWSTETRKITATLKHELGVTSVAFSPDGRLLATTSVDAKARVWRIADRRVLQTIEEHELGSVDAVAWAPTGTVLAVVSEGTIRYWGPKGAFPAGESAAKPSTEPSATPTEEMEPDVVAGDEETPAAEAAAAAGWLAERTQTGVRE